MQNAIFSVVLLLSCVFVYPAAALTTAEKIRMLKSAQFERSDAREVAFSERGALEKQNVTQTFKTEKPSVVVKAPVQKPLAQAEPDTSAATLTELSPGMVFSGEYTRRAKNLARGLNVSSFNILIKAVEGAKVSAIIDVKESIMNGRLFSTGAYATTGTFDAVAKTLVLHPNGEWLVAPSGSSFRAAVLKLRSATSGQVINGDFGRGGALRWSKTDAPVWLATTLQAAQTYDLPVEVTPDALPMEMLPSQFQKSGFRLNTYNCAGVPGGRLAYDRVQMDFAIRDVRESAHGDVLELRGDLWLLADVGGREHSIDYFIHSFKARYIPGTHEIIVDSGKLLHDGLDYAAAEIFPSGLTGVVNEDGTKIEWKDGTFLNGLQCESVSSENTGIGQYSSEFTAQQLANVKRWAQDERAKRSKTAAVEAAKLVLFDNIHVAQKNTALQVRKSLEAFGGKLVEQFKTENGLRIEIYNTSFMDAVPEVRGMYYAGADGKEYLLGLIYFVAEGYDGLQFMHKIDKRYGKPSGKKNYKRSAEAGRYWFRDGGASKIELKFTTDTGVLMMSQRRLKVIYTNTELNKLFTDTAQERLNAKQKRLQSAF